MFQWEDIFKLGASANASKFCKWVQIEIYVYIPHRKHHFKPHTLSWFSTACATVIAHRNHFFIGNDGINLLNLKWSSDRLVINAKGFLKLPNLYILMKQNSLRRNFALGTLVELPIVFSTKVNLLHFLYSTIWRCCLLHLIKQTYFWKTFLWTLFLMTKISLHLISILHLIWNYIFMKLPI